MLIRANELPEEVKALFIGKVFIPDIKEYNLTGNPKRYGYSYTVEYNGIRYTLPFALYSDNRIIEESYFNHNCFVVIEGKRILNHPEEE